MLTDAQRRVYQFICSFQQKQGYPPKITEIAKGIGLRSRGTTYRHVKALVGHQLISLAKGQHRNIRLNDKQDVMVLPSEHSLPILGRIAAGKPIEAILDRQYLEWNTLFKNNNLYALVVIGHSMIEEGILDGDWVICESAKVANNNDLIVALIDQQETTLKRYKKNNNNSITLFPANSAMQPLTFDASRVTIQGIFRGLVRTGCK